MRLQIFREQYARALRVIGQDLADLVPEFLTIETSGDNFIARGKGKSEISPSKKDRQAGTTSNIWQKLSHSSPKAQPSCFTFVRMYTPHDINKLDEIGRAHRTGSAAKPDLYSVAERLRMIGRILDEKNGALLTLSHNTGSIAFQYRDTQGQIHSEEYSNLTLYKLQQHYYSGRCFQPEDPWQAARR